MEFFNAEIVEIKPLIHNTNSFLIRLEEGKHVPYKAGQFVMLKLTDKDGKEVQRPYSIASPPPRDMKHTEYIELVIKHVPCGKLTEQLFKLKEGAKVQIAGPYGQFILREPIKEGDIFMATGSGIAPFMSMLRKIFRDHSPQEFFLFFGVQNSKEIIYEDELRQWDKEHENFRLIICLSREEKGHNEEVGYVQDKISDYVEDLHLKQAYLCGIPMMMEQSRKRLVELGMKPENIFQEKF